MKSTMPITKFFSEVLNAPLQNHFWSWGSETEDAVFLRIWIDEIDSEGRVGVLKHSNDSQSKGWESEHRLGLRERQKQLKAIFNQGKKAYGVLLKHKKDHEGNMLHGAGSIAWYDDKAVFPLIDFQTENGFTTAIVDKNRAKSVDALGFDAETAMLDIVTKAAPKGVATLNKAINLGWTLVNYFEQTAVLTFRGKTMNIDIETGVFER
ncbi:hypothetical protein ACPV5W_00420 [Vibrio astriarenae]